MQKISEEIYVKSILENSQNANLIVNSEGKILYATKSIKYLTDYIPEELQDRLFTEFMSKHEGNSAKNFLKQFIESGDNKDEFKIKLIAKGEKEIHCKGFITNLLDTPAKGLLINLFDMSLSELRIKRSSKSRKILNSVLNSIPFAIAICDQEGNFEFVNYKFEEISGYSKNETSSIIKWFRAVLSDSFYAEKMNKSFKESIVKTKILNIKKKSGEFKDIEYSIAEIKYGLKLFSFQDVTEIRQSEIALTNSLDLLAANKYLLENQNDQLETLNKKLTDSEDELKALNARKDKFFSIIAHDLRSPFNALIGMSNLIVKEFDSLDKEDIKILNTNIQKAAEFLLEMLENLLSWSRIHIGSIEYSPEKIDLHEVILDVVNSLKFFADNKNITIENNIFENIFVKADNNMIHSIIQNLLSNAIKFTDRGGRVKLNTKNSSKYFLEITVADNGIGIEKEKIEKLFDISANNSTSGTEKEKGTGLGLILCKEFIDKNGGELTVKSKLNHGTSFTFTLPVWKD